MAIKCSVCQALGHNARTCPTRANGAPAVKKPAAKKPATEPGSVVEQLEARKARLQSEIKTIDRVLPDLRTLEGTT